MRRALVCVGVLLAGVLGQGAVLAQSRMAGGGAASMPPTPYDAPSYGSQFPHSEGPVCLPARALSGVVASNDHEVILRFGRADFYRLRLTRACPALVAPGAHVVGIAGACSASYMELKVAGADGSVSRCAAGAPRQMSAAEVNAASAPAGR
jgi:hypothetical protein